MDIQTAAHTYTISSAFGNFLTFQDKGEHKKVPVVGTRLPVCLLHQASMPRAKEAKPHARSSAVKCVKSTDPREWSLSEVDYLQSGLVRSACPGRLLWPRHAETTHAVHVQSTTSLIKTAKLKSAKSHCPSKTMLICTNIHPYTAPPHPPEISTSKDQSFPVLQVHL